MQKKSPKCYQKYHLKVLKNIALLMINALIFFALLMILHYSLTILNINANALSLIFFINANTLSRTSFTVIEAEKLETRNQKDWSKKIKLGFFL